MLPYSDHCRYIGGTSSGITISEVLNTNLESGDANIKVKVLEDHLVLKPLKRMSMVF